jgi:hypothetical protein
MAMMARVRSVIFARMSAGSGIQLAPSSQM